MVVAQAAEAVQNGHFHRRCCADVPMEVMAYSYPLMPAYDCVSWGP